MTPELLTALILIVGPLVGAGGVVLWWRTRDTIAADRVAASKVAVETLVLGMAELRSQIVVLQEEIKLVHGLYITCEEHREEDRTEMSVLRDRIADLESRKERHR